MRKTALAASGFALLLALTACGSESTPTTTNTAAPQAADKPASSLFNDAQELVRTASSKADQSKTAKFTIDMNMMGQKISGSGQGSFEGTNSKMSMTMQMMGMSLEMRMIDGQVYIKMPEGQRAGGKPWIKADKAALAELGQSMDQAEQSDPRKFLEMIQKAGKINKAEPATLDGQEVSHYVIDLDLKKAGGMAGASEAQLSQLPDGVIVPLELWLNAEQLPVQITMDMGAMMKKMAEQSGQQLPPGDAKMTMKYSDWGAPVEVEAPPADQVGTMPK
ncbi:hypothetical protein [Amycolatopsis albispora]|uniref:LppX_LprAFG lipoprotein n=1 Tax=Amycolatopsis albispora TaxID=1804986 RepID=A0A344LAG4_9PSEU|nr:hypothetical protein [Amycolatopsis albispora]AXB45038.1 hypothetical protein A4R43_23170 [Amycolatopsis albispora]